ncbi:MAG: hypothetical protein IKC59_08640 [Clostridia bacterium]|nr:hypothetical protein [Clostridia bacterium]
MYLYQIAYERFRALYADETAQLSNPRRESYLFRKFVETYPLHIHRGDLLAGWYGFSTAEEQEAIYCGVGKGLSALLADSPCDGKTSVQWLSSHGFKPGNYDRGHYEHDFKTILARGLNGYLQDVERELARVDHSDSEREYLLGMRDALEVAKLFSARFAALAHQMAERENDPSERERLRRMASACERLPMSPPSDFYEAVQSAYLIWSLSCISYGEWVSVSFGSFDQYMYPYYQSSKQKGMSDEEAICILLQLFRMLDVYNGIDCVISVGGADDTGRDLTNELSYLLIEAEKRSKLRAPLFVARINRNTPKKLFRKLISKELFEMGQPSFYSEENCYEAVKERGIAPEDARLYGISTCMYPTMPGRDATHGWGCIVNTHLPLELALNGGRPFRGELPLPFRTKPRSDYRSMEEILTQYLSYLREMFDIAMEWQQTNTVRHAKEFPNPFVSLLTEDCIGRGRDRWDGGAVYQNLVVELFAFANTADAMTAIETLVFEKNAYSIAQLVEAAKVNYVGYETLHRELSKCDKYGMDRTRADENARLVLGLLSDVCEESRRENCRYLPSLHTLWEDVPWGRKRGAFLDGRLEGEPVNKNAGPTPLVRGAGPIDVALSAGKIDQIRMSGGQALDVHIGIRNLDSERNRDKIAAYIQTYFQLGGLQIQVNGLTADALQKAYESPELYPDLMVRIGGHSRYFKDFSDVMKREFINRFRIEEGSFSL